MRLFEVDSPDLSAMMEKITDECSDIVEMYRSLRRMLFRGIKGAPLYFEATPREDRRPLHSNNVLSQAFDSYLEAKGFTALRRNSIFCTNSISHAEAFGPAYVVFPKNGFTYTWTKQADIVFAPIRAEQNLDLDKINQAEIAAEKHPNAQGLRWRWVEGLPLATNLSRLKAAGIPGYEQPNELTFLDMDKFMRYYGPKRTNIEAAISRNIPTGMSAPDGYEICIRSPYYAISTECSPVIEQILGLSPTEANDAVWATHSAWFKQNHSDE